MTVKRTLVGFAVALSGMLPVIAHSQTSEPRSGLHGKFRSSSALAPVIRTHEKGDAAENFSESIAAARITAEIPGQGVVTFSFDHKWHPRNNAYFDNGFARSRDTNIPLHLRGTIALRASAANGSGRRRMRKAVAATGFVTRGKVNRLTINFLSGAQGSRPARFYEITATVEGHRVSPKVRVRRVPSVRINGKRCGESLAGQASAGAAAVPALARSSLARAKSQVGTLSLRAVQLSTEADYEWFQIYGSSSNAQIQSIINSIESIYSSQLELTFSLVSQVVLTSSTRYPPSMTNALTLLEEFQDYTRTNNHLGNADVYHLFSGKDLFGIINGSPEPNLIGLAYTGVVCSFQDFAFGLTENTTPSLNPVTTAHEIGHNFNALHTSSGIMTTTLNAGNPPTSFAAASLAEINGYLAATENSACLSPVSATPTPAPTAAPGTTPAPTPTPGSGGNGGGGITPDPDGDGPDPVDLAVTLQKTGTFSITVSVEDPSTSCSVMLRVADTQANAMRGPVIALADASARATIFNGKVARRGVKLTSKGKKAKVFIVAERSCGSETPQYSRTRAVVPNSIKVKSREIAISKWISTLKKALTKTAPERVS